jgi:hypothetical protein
MQKQSNQKRKETGGKEEMKFFESEITTKKRYTLTDYAKKLLLGLILVAIGTVYLVFLGMEDATPGFFLILLGILVIFAKELR